MFQNSTFQSEDEEEDVVIETESTTTLNPQNLLSPFTNSSYPGVKPSQPIGLYHSLYQPAASVQGFVLLIHNLHPETREEDLRDLVLDYARPLVDLRVPLEQKTGLAKGYGLVEVKDRDGAEKIKHALNGLTFMGCRLIVDYCFIHNPRIKS